MHVSTPDHYVQEIEHTADWAIRVRARDLIGLFAGAAEGMFSLLTDLSQAIPVRQFEIDLRAIDVETLLIDWLNELLYLSEEQGVVFTGFTIRDLTIDGGARLRAQVDGGRPSELFKVIKAATFHGLSIVRDDDGLQAELVFDV
ncbi:MAG TPA: archease [Anaerolineae bacterium]|nr:archease [Anaerolineae bacterium]